ELGLFCQILYLLSNAITALYATCHDDPVGFVLSNSQFFQPRAPSRDAPSRRYLDRHHAYKHDDRGDLKCPNGPRKGCSRFPSSIYWLKWTPAMLRRIYHYDVT